MHNLRAHPRLAALAVALLAVAAVFGVALARSTSSSCSAPPPLPSLPAQLRTLGDFDQPYDASATRALQDAALRVAAQLHEDLATTVVGDPVPEAAADGARYDAIVFPLLNGGGPGSAPTVTGLVAFLRDCSGHAWYHAVDDLLHDTNVGVNRLPSTFPAVSRAEAARRLGGGDVRLVSGGDVFRPRWQAGAGGPSIDAMVP